MADGKAAKVLLEDEEAQHESRGYRMNRRREKRRREMKKPFRGGFVFEEVWFQFTNFVEGALL